MQTSKPGRASDQFALRLPDGMRDRIKAAADANGRSMNAEIVATLEENYPAPKLPGPTATDLAEIMEHIFSSASEADQDARLDDANRVLNESGQSISLRFSAERDDKGLRAIIMAIH